jgi:hypothetical protein
MAQVDGAGRPGSVTTAVDGSDPRVSAAVDSISGPETPSLFALMDTLDCDGVSRVCQQTIPSLFFTGLPDSLLEVLYYWEDACGMAEPITRTMILGAIWDRAFVEDLYGDEIMDFLVWYEDPARLQGYGRDVDPDLAPGGVASEADFTTEREAFDAFTISLADQLLPHTQADTPEHFFCLFYSGRSQEAWRLLQGNALKGTYLKRQYDWELERIAIERRPYDFFVSVGYWSPRGNLAVAGEKMQLGIFLEKRTPAVFGRAGLEFLIGRTVSPYVVDQPEGRGRSDRFTVATVIIEGGITVLRSGRHGVDLFTGAGLDLLNPFLKEDAPTEVLLVNFKGVLGAGYRIGLGRHNKLSLGVDGRWEWMPDRNNGGTPLDGTAWNCRLTLSYNRNHELDRRLQGLGR